MVDRDEARGWTEYRCMHQACGMAEVVSDRGMVIPYTLWVTRARIAGAREAAEWEGGAA